MKKRLSLKTVTLWAASAVLACALLISAGQSEAADPLLVYTVNYPLKYFAERVGGDSVKVVFPAPAEGDPAYWQPDIPDISAFQKADLILLNGANYAKWVQKASLPGSKLVDTSAKFRDLYISADDIVTHSHGSDGKHAHEALAFTTWLDLNLASQQAGAIAAALGRSRPDLKPMFQQNFAALEKDLAALDRRIMALAARNPGQPLVVSHPVYDYFARRYGLSVKSVHWEPDEMPGASQWIDLQSMVKDHPAKWMIWEGTPRPESVAKLQSMGISSAIFDPCGNAPGQGDFLSVMKQNVKNITAVFP